MCNGDVLLETKIDLPVAGRGKVRDIYDLGENLLFVATDRISAFDCVLGSAIPCKGEVLTQISLFWFEQLRNIARNHVLTADEGEFPSELKPYRNQLHKRSMIVKKAEMVPIECVARGYLSGSGWREYQASGSICGIPLPTGLEESAQLPEPLFTPATKSQSGHDENVSFSQVADRVGTELAELLRDLTLDLYKRASEYALKKGLILADTKFEFGFVNDELVLADEALTPDSSRYWQATTYAPGGPQQSFDKQFVRDYLDTLIWDKRPPAPALPPDVVDKTKQKYLEAYELLTGHPL